MKKPKKNKDGHYFTENEILAFQELGEVLRGVVNRLVREGKAKIVNGKVVHLDEKG